LHPTGRVGTMGDPSDPSSSDTRTYECDNNGCPLSINKITEVEINERLTIKDEVESHKKNGSGEQGGQSTV
jgi:hypothetical protein